METICTMIPFEKGYIYMKLELSEAKCSLGQTYLTRLSPLNPTHLYRLVPFSIICEVKRVK